jgi:uncharacterized protein YqjF (DUF2071 family)
MAIIKWKTGLYGTDIERVECTRETEHTVWMMGRWGNKKKERKAAKVAEFARYHDSWELARDFLVETGESKVAAARLMLERAQGFLGNAKGLRKPSEPDAEAAVQDVA